MSDRRRGGRGVLATRFRPVADRLEPRVVLSTTLASGDFNGDGLADLAIGAPYEDVFDSAAGFNRTNAGAVTVLYGQAGAGLGSAGSDFWTQDSPSVPGTLGSNDLFGRALAAGDFNDDGYDDLAIGIPGDVVSGLASAGSVLVLRGSMGGLATFELRTFSQADFGTDNAPEAGARFGEALAAGDFDGDGRDDLAIGAPGEDLPGIANAGTVSVLYGHVLQLSTSGRQVWHQEVVGVLGAAHADDRFGAALISGDFNGDGRDDLAVGAPGDRPDFLVGAGGVNVFYGQATDGLDKLHNQHWHQNSPAIVGVAEAGDAFGWALAAGDFDSDGYDDLAVGVPGEGVVDSGGVTREEAGAVNVIYGSANRLASAKNDLWNQGGDGLPGSPNAGDYFGASLAAANFDTLDGDDLAIGAPGETLAGWKDNAGAVHVLYSDAGVSGGLTAAFGDYWTQDGVTFVSDAYIDAGFGSAMIPGDFDGLLGTELAIAAPGQRFSPFDRAGAVEVLDSTFAGLEMWFAEPWHQGSDGVPDANETDDFFGGAPMDALHALAAANAMVEVGDGPGRVAGAALASTGDPGPALIVWDASIAEVAATLGLGDGAGDRRRARAGG